MNPKIENIKKRRRASGEPFRTRSVGTQNIAWDGTDDAGQNLPSGVYYYTVKMGDSKRSSRLVLMK